MSYFAEPNYIEYDLWFDENIDPLDLVDYLNEKEYSDSVHHKFYQISRGFGRAWEGEGPGRSEGFQAP